MKVPIGFTKFGSEMDRHPSFWRSLGTRPPSQRTSRRALETTVGKSVLATTGFRRDLRQIKEFREERRGAALDSLALSNAMEPENARRGKLP